MTNQDAKILIEYITMGTPKKRLQDMDRSFLVSLYPQVIHNKDLSNEQGKLLQAMYRRSQGGA